MSVNINEHEHSEQIQQKQQKPTRRKWLLTALGVLMLYISPTVNSILQQFLASKFPIIITISGFQLNVVLLLCEILFTWVIAGVAFMIGMMALPVMILSSLAKQKVPRSVRIALTIVFPVILAWNYFFEKWYDRQYED